MFVSTAFGMGTSPAGTGGMDSLLVQFMPLLLMVAIFYFLLIRPQQKRAKAHRTMLAALNKGDHVMTSGGILGRIVEIEQDVLTLDLGTTKIKVGRGYIGGKFDPKELQNAMLDKKD